MKKTQWILISLFSLGMLSACATFSKASERNLYQVHLGQSKAELTAALGEPERVDRETGEERWHYVIYSENARQTYPYTATFIDEKLSRWDFDTSTVQRNREIRDQDRRHPSSL